MWDTKRGVSRLNTLEKCVRILTLFSEAAQTLQVSEIADQLGLPRSSAYRYISALRAHNLIEVDPDDGGYRLGPAILDLAASMQRKPLHDLSLPHMKRISRETGETVILCGIRENAGVCLEKVEGHHALRVSYELGDSYPLHAAATGKVILAFLGADEQERVLRLAGLPQITDRTITDPRKLRQKLAKIRKDGYAESFGESIMGTRGMAVPIFARSGHVVASIGVSVPEHRAQGANRERIVQLLLQAAEAVTNGLATTVRSQRSNS